MIDISISSATAVSALLAATPSDAASTQLLTGPMVLGLIVVALLLSIGVCYLAQRWRGSPHDNAHAMFRDLCRIHHLRRYQVQLLKRLGVDLKLDCPCVLFVDNTLWQLPVAPVSTRSFTEKEWQKLHVVQRTLFLPAAVKTPKPATRS